MPVMFFDPRENESKVVEPGKCVEVILAEKNPLFIPTSHRDGVHPTTVWSTEEGYSLGIDTPPWRIRPKDPHLNVEGGIQLISVSVAREGQPVS